MRNYFHVFHLFMYGNCTFFLPFSFLDAHTRSRNLSALLCKLINKIVSQLKSHMTFLSKVLEAVQLKDSLLVDAAEHSWETHRCRYLHALNLSLSLITALVCTSIAQVSVISSKMMFWNLQQKVWDEERKTLLQRTLDFRTETWQK